MERNGIHMQHNHNGGGGGIQPSLRRTGFTKCMCQCLFLLRFLPFVMISALFIWGFYVYLYFIIFQGYQQVLIRIVLIIFFLPLYILSGCSYIRTVFTSNRPITDEFQLPESIDLNGNEDVINQALEQVILTRNLPVYTRSFGGYVRYCRKCLVIKPDRSHHCSTCGSCIRKMVWSLFCWSMLDLLTLFYLTTGSPLPLGQQLCCLR